MDRSPEQKLIDIMFSVALTSAEYKWKNREEHMEWVARQLKECGFPTIQMGSSWGVLERSYYDKQTSNKRSI